MTHSVDENELIRRLRAGEESAVREVFAAYGQRLYAYALRLTNDRAAADDVTQAALVAAWQKVGSFRGEGRFLAWLLGIVHHTAWKLRRGAMEALDESHAEIVEDEPSPEERVLLRQEQVRVRQGLRSLSVKHRAVLELIFYQGLSLAEAAQVLQCPVGTVKSRLSYARDQLREVLTRTEENLP